MPRVPTVGLNASPRPAFQAPGVTAFRDYAPQQIQQAGKAMEGMGQVITDIAFKIENDIHDANTLEASNEAEFASRSLLQKQEQRKGKEAVDAKQGVLDEFKATMSGISDRLHPIERRQFKKIQDRLQGRFTLRVEAHHAKTAAEHKQQGLLARKAVLADKILTAPISYAANLEKVLGEGQHGAIASTEFLSDYTRYLATAREEGVLKGYSDEVAEEEVLGEGQDPRPRKRTTLTEDEESKFQKDWAALALELGLDPDLDHPLHKYDYRGAWKAGKLGVGPEKHFPSEWKDYDHPNRFVEGHDTITGLPASPLAIFVQGESDKLFKALVTAKLDSKDPREVNEVERLVNDLPRGLISQSLLEDLQDRSSVKAQESEDTVALIKSYDDGETLSEVFADIDARLELGIITSEEHKNRRADAKDYYTQQNNAKSVDKELLLNEVAVLRAQGKPVPEALRDRAIGLQAVREFDRIVSGQDSWLPSGREAYLRYMENPNQLLSDMGKDPDLLIRLNSQMPWSVVMELSKMAKKQKEANSGGSGTSSKSRSKLSLWTNRGKALNLHYKYSRTLADKNGTTVEDLTKELSQHQKTDIEFRWRIALEEASIPYLDEGLSAAEALDKGAEDLWQRGTYTDGEGNTRNVYTDVAGALPEDIANLQNERDENGRLQVDIAREELETESIDEEVARRVKQERAAKMPPSPALLGMVDYWGTMDRATGKVLADLQASEQVFGIPLALPPEVRRINQQQVNARARQNIEENKEAKHLASEEGKKQRRLRAVSSLNKIMETEAYDSLVEEGKGVGFFTDAYNTLGWFFTSHDTRYEKEAAWEALPGEERSQVDIGTHAAKTITISEGGKKITVFEEFMNAGGTEEEWNQIVLNHKITDHFLAPKDPASSDPGPATSATQQHIRTRRRTTAADYATPMTPEMKAARSKRTRDMVGGSARTIWRKTRALERRIVRLERLTSAHADDEAHQGSNLQKERENSLATLKKELEVKLRALEMARKRLAGLGWVLREESIDPVEGKNVALTYDRVEGGKN